MGHCHEHYHHDVPSNYTFAFVFGIGLNVIFTIIEYIVGYSYDSLALISDATHNLSDVASLGLSLIGMLLLKKHSTKLYTYGFKKVSILASLINSVILVAVTINIFVHAFERISAAPEVSGIAVMFVAFIGFVINIVAALLFLRGQSEDINIKGAFLHLLADALVSIGVVFSGLIIYFTDWYIVDTVTSFIIGVMVFLSTIGILKESIRLTLDAAPNGLDSEEVKEIILSVDKVDDIKHIHIWALSSTENAFTAIVELDEGASLLDFAKVNETIKEKLQKLGISHITLEPTQKDFKTNMINKCGYN